MPNPVSIQHRLVTDGRTDGRTDSITMELWNKLPEEVVSASSVSAFISRLNSMHVSFLMFCFSAVCFFINVSFRAVVSAHSSALYCFYCIVSVLMNKIFIHSYSSVVYYSIAVCVRR